MRDSDAFHSCSFCRRQAIRVEELEETVRQLREELSAVGYRAPKELGLSATQETIVGMMLQHDRFLSPESLFDATPHVKRKDEFEGFQVVEVQITKLRQRLRPFKLEIERGHRKGWRLTPESRERLLNWNAHRAEAA